MAYVKARHPDVPLIYYANGGSPYLGLQADMACDMISLDWQADMALARQTLGPQRLVQVRACACMAYDTNNYNNMT